MFGTKYDTAPKKYNTSKTTIYQESNTPSYTEDIEADLSYKGYEGIIRGIVESYENAALVDNYLRQAQKKEFEMKACCMNEDAIESFHEASVGSATQIVIGSMQRFIAKIKGVMQNYNQQIRKYFDKKNIENFKRQVKNLDKEKCKEKTLDEYEAPLYPETLLAPLNIDLLNGLVIKFTENGANATDTNEHIDGATKTKAISADNGGAQIKVAEVDLVKDAEIKLQQAKDNQTKINTDANATDNDKTAAATAVTKAQTKLDEAKKAAENNGSNTSASATMEVNDDADNTAIADEMIRALLHNGIGKGLTQEEVQKAGLSDFGELYHKMCYKPEESNVKIDPDVMFKPLENGKNILTAFSNFEKQFDALANNAIKNAKASKLSDNAAQIKALNRNCTVMSNVCLQSTGILFKELQFGIHQANTVFNLAIGSAVSISLKGKGKPQVNNSSNETPAEDSAPKDEAEKKDVSDKEGDSDTQQGVFSKIGQGLKKILPGSDSNS